MSDSPSPCFPNHPHFCRTYLLLLPCSGFKKQDIIALFFSFFFPSPRPLACRNACTLCINQRELSRRMKLQVQRSRSRPPGGKSGVRVPPELCSLCNSSETQSRIYRLKATLLLIVTNTLKPDDLLFQREPWGLCSLPTGSLRRVLKVI